jgi:hypothetical protein
MSEPTGGNVALCLSDRMHCPQCGTPLYYSETYGGLKDRPHGADQEEPRAGAGGRPPAGAADPALSSGAPPTEAPHLNLD